MSRRPPSVSETPASPPTTSAPSERVSSAPPHRDLLADALRSATLSLSHGDWALHHDESFAHSALDQLAAAVRTVARGGEPSLASAPWTAIARPLMDVLRRQLLSATAVAADQEAFAECHALLVALERVHDHLGRDDLYRVSDQLGGAGALDLLVEVAHDMRSPLGSILFLVDRVRSGQSGELSEPAARQLGLVYSAAFGLSALASDLMELARGNGRLMGGEPVPFSLSELFRRLQGMVGPVAEEKGLALVVEPPPRDVRVGHPAALLRVLLNLSTNACKFTSRGEVRVRASECPDGTVLFEVEDTGTGVPADVAARLFETFSLRTGSGVHSGGRAFSSAGLGLAISRKLVMAMGGSLVLDQQRHIGTRLSFAVPLSRATGHQVLR